MASLRFLKTIHRKTALIAFALLVVALSTTSTKAGFEWVPGGQQEPAPSAPSPSSSSRIQVIEPALQGYVPPPPLPDERGLQQLPLAPMPGLEASEILEASPPPPAPAPRPRTIQTLQVQPRPEAAPPLPPMEEPQPAPQIKRMATTPSYESPRYAAEPAPAPSSFSQGPMMPELKSDQPETLETLKMPPRREQNTKIIMPEDAPRAAKDLQISSFPDQQDLAVTKDEPLFSSGVQNNAPLAAAPQAPSAAAPVQYDVVEGFGSDVPLALALRQVVPAGYAFSFGQNVNPGYRVSWSGGKPWNEVIRDMIADLNYKVQIGTKTVFISSMETSALQIPETEIQIPAMDAPIEVQPVSVIEPASGGPAGAEDMQPVNRARDIRRVNVVDPGTEQQISQPESALQKIALAADKATKMLGFSSDAEADSDLQGNAGQAWSASANDSLKDTLERWSKQEGVLLVWDVSYDYPINAAFETQGSFEEAVQFLLSQNQDPLAFKLLGSAAQRQLLIQDKA